ncbi:hypothetical protein H5410_062611 [Solanum commersonii]|uniref:Disease resistance N-terminal domain-containing protein n=1 Tax=Solanum commersonii TaxID=4109 RepID=A0A9J5WBD1_SOLCO|nr:hypothetical protein H5410_062611 [Solanum commersonii]
MASGYPLESFERGHRLAPRVLRHIRSYVDDAKAKEVGGDSRVKNLLKDIQELAGDVEDLLDEFLPKIQQSKTVSFANEFAVEIEKIRRRVADIDSLRTTFNITDTSNNNNDCIPMEQRREFLHADETEVIGLDDDFNKLQDKLLVQDLCNGVVSIVGMPGLEKQLLPRNFIGMSAINLSVLRPQVGLTDEERKEHLEDKLRSLLETKRYIGEDFSPTKLQPLDSEKSFELFTKKIFIFDNNNNWANASPALVDIGKSIVRDVRYSISHCGDGGMLRARERTEHAWNRDHEIAAFDLTNMWIAEKWYDSCK